MKRRRRGGKRVHIVSGRGHSRKRVTVRKGRRRK